MRALPRSLLALLLALALAACSSSGGSSGSSAADGGATAGAQTSSGEPVPEGEALTVGWILAGPADQAAVDAVGAAFPGRVENVVADDAADPGAAASELAAQGAALVVSAVPGACEAVPDVDCVEPPAEGWWNRAYLIGRAVGLLTETDTVGYVAAAATPAETAAVNSFALGCQSGNPNCVVRLVVSPPNPAGALKRFRKQNADVIATTSPDAALCDAPPKLLAVQPVLAAGDPCGRAFVSTDLAALAQPVVESVLDGTFDGSGPAQLPLDAWSDSVPSGVRDKVEQRAAEIEGGRNVFTGPLYDNQGTQQLAEDEELDATFVAAQWSWLLGGVLEEGGS